MNWSQRWHLSSKSCDSSCYCSSLCTREDQVRSEKSEITTIITVSKSGTKPHLITIYSIAYPHQKYQEKHKNLMKTCECERKGSRTRVLAEFNKQEQRKSTKKKRISINPDRRNVRKLTYGEGRAPGSGKQRFRGPGGGSVDLRSHRR